MLLYPSFRCVWFYRCMYCILTIDCKVQLSMLQAMENMITITNDKAHGQSKTGSKQLCGFEIFYSTFINWLQMVSKIADIQSNYPPYVTLLHVKMFSTFLYVIWIQWLNIVDCTIKLIMVWIIIPIVIF